MSKAPLPFPPSMLSSQCRSCDKSFKCGSSLLKHIMQTECKQHYTPMFSCTTDFFFDPGLHPNAADDSPCSDDDNFPAFTDDDSLVDDNQVHLHIAQRASYDRDTQIEVALLHLIKDIGASLESFQRIMKWVSNAHDLNYDFKPKRATYQSQMKHLEGLMKMSCL